MRTFQTVCTPAGEAVVQFYMMVNKVKKIVVSRGKKQGEKNLTGIWKLYWYDPEEVTPKKKECPEPPE